MYDLSLRLLLFPLISILAWWVLVQEAILNLSTPSLLQLSWPSSWAFTRSSWWLHLVEQNLKHRVVTRETERGCNRLSHCITEYLWRCTLVLNSCLFKPSSTRVTLLWFHRVLTARGQWWRHETTARKCETWKLEIVECEQNREMFTNSTNMRTVAKITKQADSCYCNLQACCLKFKFK